MKRSESRIGKLRKMVGEFGVEIKDHYTDGPNSDASWRGHQRFRDRGDGQVMITADLSGDLDNGAKEKILVYLWFQPDVQRVYFTKKTDRLKVIYNCRSNFGG